MSLINQKIDGAQLTNELLVDCEIKNCVLNDCRLFNCKIVASEFKTDATDEVFEKNTIEGCVFTHNTTKKLFKDFFGIFSEHTKLENYLSGLDVGPLNGKNFHTIKIK